MFIFTFYFPYSKFDEWGRKKLKQHVQLRSSVSLVEFGEQFVESKPSDDAPVTRKSSCCDGSSMKNTELKGDQFHVQLPKRIGVLRQFFLLTHQHVLLLSRNPETSAMRFVQAIFLSLICGLIYLQLDMTQSGLQNRVGALFFILTMVFMGSLYSVLELFPTHRPIFLRDRAARAYSGIAYWNAKSFIEVPYDIVFSFLTVVIAYYMVGLQASRFGLFYLTMMLTAFCSSSLAFFISSGVSDVAYGLMISPIVMIPLMICK